MMSSLHQWNAWQISVMRRYCAMHHVPLTPEVVVRLATRFAAKHEAERPVARGVTAFAPRRPARPSRRSSRRAAPATI